MRRKVGEVLIEKGLITPDQLEIALRNQLILGGHLGTCLLELGFVEEDRLGETLAEVLQVPYATPAVLRAVQPPTLRSLPKRVAEEFQVLPIDRKDKTLHVAMVDPKDLAKLDALAFVSNHKIVPWIAPEIRIVEALERYYNIPRRTRYIAIARSIDRDTTGSADPATAPSDPGLLGETYSSGRSAKKESYDFGAEFGYGRSWVEVAEELCGKGPEDEATAEVARKDGDARRAPDDGASLLAETSERLCAANDKDEIAAAVLDRASRSLARALLLAVRGEEATVWSAVGFPPGVGAASPARFPIRRGTIFDLLLGNERYAGPLPREPRYLDFYRALGAEPPEEILFIPVHLSDRLVALLLGDGGPVGRIQGDLRDHVGLVRMLGLALSMLILKKKIRAGSESGIRAPRDPGSK